MFFRVLFLVKKIAYKGKNGLPFNISYQPVLALVLSLGIAVGSFGIAFADEVQDVSPDSDTIVTLGANDGWDLRNFTSGIVVKDGETGEVIDLVDGTYDLQDGKSYKLFLSFEETIKHSFGFRYKTDLDPGNPAHNGKLVYVLPAGIKASEAMTGAYPVKGATDEITIGTYEVTTDAEGISTVTVSFENVDMDGNSIDPENFIDFSTAAQFTFDMDATFSDTGGGGSFDFGNGQIIVPKPDGPESGLAIEKIASSFDTAAETIDYTIEITALNGPVNNITLWDYAQRMTNETTTAPTYIFREDGQIREGPDGVKIFPYGPAGQGGNIKVAFYEDGALVKTADLDEVPWNPYPVDKVSVPGLPDTANNVGVGLFFDMDKYYGGGFTLNPNTSEESKDNKILVTYTMDISDYIDILKWQADEKTDDNIIFDNRNVYNIGFIDNHAVANGKDPDGIDVLPVKDEAEVSAAKQNSLTKTGTGSTVKVTVKGEDGKDKSVDAYRINWTIKTGDGTAPIGGQKLTDALGEDLDFYGNHYISVVLKDKSGRRIEHAGDHTGWTESPTGPETAPIPALLKPRIENLYSLYYLTGTKTYWYTYDSWGMRTLGEGNPAWVYRENAVGDMEVRTDGFDYTIPKLTGGVPEVYYADIVYSTIDMDPIAHEGSYKNSVRADEGPWVEAEVGQGPVGTTLTKSNRLVYNGSDDNSFVEYKLALTVPAGNEGKNIFLRDSNSFSNGKDRYIQPENVENARDDKNFKNGISVSLNGVTQQYNDEKLYYQIHYKFAGSHYWYMTFGDNTTASTANTERNSALAAAFAGTTEWPFEDAQTVEIIYKVPLNTVAADALTSNLSNTGVVTVGEKLQNGVLYQGTTNSRERLNNAAYTYINSTAYVNSATTNLVWPIVKAAGAGVKLADAGSEYAGYAGKIPYTVTLNDDTAWATDRLFVEGEPIYFSDVFDARLDFDPKSFYIELRAADGVMYDGADEDTEPDRYYLENSEFTIEGNEDEPKTLSIDLAQFAGRIPKHWVSGVYESRLYSATSLILHYDLLVDEETAKDVGAAEDGGVLKFDNKATITTTDDRACDGSFSAGAEASYGELVVSKGMTYNNDGATADTVIVINPEGKDLSSEKYITVTDDMTKNLLFDFSTIEIRADKNVDGVFEGREIQAIREVAQLPEPELIGDADCWTWAPEGAAKAHFIIPDDIPVKISYTAQIKGLVGEAVPIQNKVSITGGFFSDFAKTFTIVKSSASGSSDRSTLPLIKVDGADQSVLLDGAAFHLYIGLPPEIADDFDYQDESESYKAPAGVRQSFSIEGEDWTFFYLQSGVTNEDGRIEFNNAYLARKHADNGAIYAAVEVTAPVGYMPVEPLPDEGPVPQDGLDSVWFFTYGTYAGTVADKSVETATDRMYLPNESLFEPYVSAEVDKDTIKRTSAAFDGTDAGVTADGTVDGTPIYNIGEADEQYRYDIDFRSTSNASADEFVVDDPLESVAQGYVRLEGLWTPAVWGDMDGLMNIWYKTAEGSGEDLSASAPWMSVTTIDNPVYPVLPADGWKLWTHIDQSKAADYTGGGVIDRVNLALPAGLSEGDYITDIRFEYGAVKVGFTSKNNADEPMNANTLENDGAEPIDDAGQVRNTNGSDAYYGEVIETLEAPGQIVAADIMRSMHTVSIQSSLFKMDMSNAEENPPTPEPSAPSEDAGVPAKGTTGDWTPVSGLGYYPTDAEEMEQLQDAALRPATYLVSATKPLGDENNNAIVSSASAKIAKYIPETADAGNMSVFAVIPARRLYDQDQDAVLTRVIVPFTANPEENGGYIEEGEPFFETADFDEEVTNGQWYTGVGRRVVTVARTGDLFALSLWFVLAIGSLICLLLLVRTLPKDRGRERKPNESLAAIQGGERK